MMVHNKENLCYGLGVCVNVYTTRICLYANNDLIKYAFTLSRGSKVVGIIGMLGEFPCSFSEFIFKVKV